MPRYHKGVKCLCFQGKGGIREGEGSCPQWGEKTEEGTHPFLRSVVRWVWEMIPTGPQQVRGQRAGHVCVGNPRGLRSTGPPGACNLCRVDLRDHSLQCHVPGQVGILSCEPF